MIAVGHEADLVAVGFLGDAETQLTRMLADLRLVERTDRKHGVRELRLRQREEEVRLVLCLDRRRAAAGIVRVPSSRSTRA